VVKIGLLFIAALMIIELLLPQEEKRLVVNEYGVILPIVEPKQLQSSSVSIGDGEGAASIYHETDNGTEGTHMVIYFGTTEAAGVAVHNNIMALEWAERGE